MQHHGGHSTRIQHFASIDGPIKGSCIQFRTCPWYLQKEGSHKKCSSEAMKSMWKSPIYTCRSIYCTLIGWTILTTLHSGLVMTKNPRLWMTEAKHVAHCAQQHDTSSLHIWPCIERRWWCLISTLLCVHHAHPIKRSHKCVSVTDLLTNSDLGCFVCARKTGSIPDY